MESLKKRFDGLVTSLTKKQDGSADKDSKIVYIFAPPGTGKTFTGDYMHVVHGYHHIDGDIPIKNMAVKPEYQELVEKWLVQDDWAPHFTELARLTLEAAKDHDTVVLTHATDRNVIREHVIQKLIEGGASEDNITIVQLTIDPKVKARGIYLRAKRQAEQVGITITDYCKAWIDSEGEMTEERFTDMYKEQIEPIFRAGREFEVHPKALMVDVSGRDITHFDNVDKALGLTRPDDWTYESICEKVKPFDEARDKVMLEGGMAEVFAEIMAKKDTTLAIEEAGEDEKKVEEMKRRRSSIIQCELLMRDLSSSIKCNEKMQNRRKSLIKIGKIEN